MTNNLPVVTSGESLFGYIRRHLDPDGRLPEGIGLPDEDATQGIRWSPGSLGAVNLDRSPPWATSDRAGEVVAALLAACREHSQVQLRALYTTVATDDVSSYVGDLRETLYQERVRRSSDLRAIGCWLLTTASDRGPVKLGLVLLGDAGVDPDAELVRTIGAHEEFTGYAAVALHRGARNGESEVWTLARSVRGAVRAACARVLAGTADPDIRAWLRDEGFTVSDRADPR